MSERLVKELIKLGIALGCILVVAIFVRACCFTFVDSYEMGYRYDSRNGQISRVGRTGYVFHAPLVVDVDIVDLRPMQVCINANSRVLNCKLVQFNPSGLETFLSWHGRGDYDYSANETCKLRQILLSYAYDGSGKNYPFLTIIRELKPEEAIDAK